MLLVKEISEIKLNVNKISTDLKHFVKRQDWDNKINEIDSKNLKEEDKSQWLMLQLIFLFWGWKIKEIIFSESKLNKKTLNRAMDDIFTKVNKFTPKEEAMIPSQVGLDEILIFMFESSFNDVAKRIFYNTVPETRAIPRPEAILGVIAGISLENTNLVRTSLLKLLGQTKTKEIAGLFAMLTNDPNLEKEVKSTWKILKAKSDLVLSLVELYSDDLSERDNFI